MKTEIIIFGQGCFWCSQAVFQRVKGVVSVTAGYSGGQTEKPTYDEVCSGITGHAEVVQVVYEPSVVALDQLLEIFWKTHDPTTLNRQGADVGTQYRSAIFYSNEQQKRRAVQYKNELNNAGVWDKPIVTEISPIQNFYPAEDYHQDYYQKNPVAGYCQFVIVPKLEKFKNIFSDMYVKYGGKRNHSLQ